MKTFIDSFEKANREYTKKMFANSNLNTESLESQIDRMFFEGIEEEVRGDKTLIVYGNGTYELV